MKAISLQQPWAQFIIDGIKPIETRKWRTNHRGDLLICAAKKVQEQLPHSTIKIIEAKGYTIPNDLPLGRAICVVDLVNCRPMKREDDIDACIAKFTWAFAFEIRNIRPVKQVEVRGQLGLFDVPDELIEYL